MVEDAEVLAAREKLKAKFAKVRTGGRGTVRRKKHVAPKNATNDDKKLQGTLKRLGVQPIPGIEEVNLFMEDSKVVHFVNPKVQAAVAANTFIVQGVPKTQELSELLPGIFSQLDQQTMLNKWAQNMEKERAKLVKEKGKGKAPAVGDKEEGEGEGETVPKGGDDEGIPDIVEDFEEVSENK